MHEPDPRPWCRFGHYEEHARLPLCVDADRDEIDRLDTLTEPEPWSFEVDTDPEPPQPEPYQLAARAERADMDEAFYASTWARDARPSWMDHRPADRLAAMRQAIAEDYHRDARAFTGNPTATRWYIERAMAPGPLAQYHELPERDKPNGIRGGIGASDRAVINHRDRIPFGVMGPRTLTQAGAGALWSLALRGGRAMTAAMFGEHVIDGATPTSRRDGLPRGW